MSLYFTFAQNGVVSSEHIYENAVCIYATTHLKPHSESDNLDNPAGFSVISCICCVQKLQQTAICPKYKMIP